MTAAAERLTTREDWSRRGSRIDRHPDLGQAPWFRQQARLMGELLGGRGYRTAVEIGVYPGNILAWMASRFRVDATGLEYVPEQAAAVRVAFPEFEVIEGDFLDGSWCAPGRTWDIVASFGLVEHWADPTEAIAAHQARTAPGGCCVIGVPNHSGCYGRLMRRLDPAMWDRHSRISAPQLQAAFVAAADRPWRIDFCGAIEGPGLWNCGMAEWIERRRDPVRGILRGGYGAFHRFVTPCPAPPLLRPNLLLVATRIEPPSHPTKGESLA